MHVNKFEILILNVHFSILDAKLNDISLLLILSISNHVLLIKSNRICHFKIYIALSK